MRFCRLRMPVKPDTAAACQRTIDSLLARLGGIDPCQQCVSVVIQNWSVLARVVNPLDYGLSGGSHRSHFRYTLPLSIQ